MESTFGHRHLMEQPPRVGRDGFEVSALGLGIQGAKGERGLAGAGHTREHDQGVARDIDGDVLEIVLPRPADPNEPVPLVGVLACGTSRLFLI